jgi:acetoin:2,6-dichlorophenolindophenol oxidoreductase subunit alpha
MNSAAHDRPGKTTNSPVRDGVLLENPASNSHESSLKLGRSELLRAYGIMRTIREFEERLHLEFATGDIPGFVHLYAGEEAIATAFCMNLDQRDKITSTHRGHGHCLAKGCDLHGMMAEIYGRKSGLCAGKGGSMHIADLAKGMLGANGIVGGGPPLACGAALSAKKLGSGGVAVTFVGDGGANQGTTLESLNLASIWKLPCIFVIENNGYAEATSCKYSSACHDFADRAQGFNMPGVIVDGHDFFAVYKVAAEAVQRARTGGGPTLVECKVSRYYGHFEGDAQSYRAHDEVKKIREGRDCLTNFAQKVTSAGLLKSSELGQIDAEVLAVIEDSVVKAKAASKPSAPDLLADVYVSY